MVIEISLRCDDVIEEMEEFLSSEKAEEYFYQLARKRTRLPSIVLATVDGDFRMMYHIDDAYAENRWQMSMDLTTGLPVKRRYIPSLDELTGRKSRKEGRRLPPIIVPLDVYSQLQERAQRAGVSLADLRRQAYMKLLDDNDTVLSNILS